MSDVVLAESATAAQAPARFAPPAAAAARRPSAQTGRAARDKAPMALLPGAKVDDFEIVRLLGRGAFGHVYLARQMSLDRLVALKISANRGSEGRTMARLEHQHIVQVFSETVDPDFNQRLLCMQLVPGIGLDKLIGMLHATARAGRAASEPIGRRRSEWTGAELLAIIDRSASLPAALDPSALHDREALGKMDAVEATAWFGARLAEALDFAHRHGVLHRDIKPANILVNPYGRPMLADFNISSQPVGSEVERRRNVRRHVRLHVARASRRVQSRRHDWPRGRDRAVGHVFAGPGAAAIAGRPDELSAVRIARRTWPTRCGQWPSERRQAAARLHARTARRPT